MRVRACFGRRQDLGLQDKLMVELRSEDPWAFNYFMQMPLDMFQKLVEQFGPRSTRLAANFCRRLDLKVGLTMSKIFSLKLK